jgi:hypothetical protein
VTEVWNERWLEIQRTLPSSHGVKSLRTDAPIAIFNPRDRPSLGASSRIGLANKHLNIGSRQTIGA